MRPAMDVQEAADSGRDTATCFHCRREHRIERGDGRAFLRSHDGPCGRPCAGGGPEGEVGRPGLPVHAKHCPICDTGASFCFGPSVRVRFLRDGALGNLPADLPASFLPDGADPRTEWPEGRVAESAEVEGPYHVVRGLWLPCAPVATLAACNVGARVLVWAGRMANATRLWEAVELVAPMPYLLRTDDAFAAMAVMREELAQARRELETWRESVPASHTGMGERQWLSWPVMTGRHWAYRRPTGCTDGDMVTVMAFDDGDGVQVRHAGKVYGLDDAPTFGRRFLPMDRMKVSISV